MNHYSKIKIKNPNLNEYASCAHLIIRGQSSKIVNVDGTTNTGKVITILFVFPANKDAVEGIF